MMIRFLYFPYIASRISPYFDSVSRKMYVTRLSYPTKLTKLHPAKILRKREWFYRTKRLPKKIVLLGKLSKNGMTLRFFCLSFILHHLVILVLTVWNEICVRLVFLITLSTLNCVLQKTEFETMILQEHKDTGKKTARSGKLSKKIRYGRWR